MIWSEPEESDAAGRGVLFAKQDTSQDMPCGGNKTPVILRPRCNGSQDGGSAGLQRQTGERLRATRCAGR